MNRNLSQQKHSGFTLIEVMVSVSIFVIIVTIGIGSLLTVNRALQKSRIERQAVDSLSYVMDTMTRRLRTGTNYQVITEDQIQFKEQTDTEINNGAGQIIQFALVDVAGHGAIQMTEGSSLPDIITPPEIDVTAFNVQVMKGSGQPLALISIKATIKNKDQESDVGIQAAVSQRPFEQPTAPTA